jgi:hypothetical protein
MGRGKGVGPRYFADWLQVGNPVLAYAAGGKVRRPKA